MGGLSTDLSTANARLKALGCKCSITERGDLKYLQATLPTKDGLGKKQQRIPLGKLSLVAAEKKAMELGQLMLSGFTWEQWEAPLQTSVTFADFRAAGRKLYESRYSTETAWTKKWRPALNKLPPDSVPCNESLILAVVNSLKPNSAGRRDCGNILSQIAHSLKMDGGPIQEAARGYSASKVEKRDIPKDELIEEIFKKITLPHWRWMYGMCATYGLRPHEIVECRIDKDGNCHISDETKTGFHIAWPCHQRWIKDFKLRKEHRPPFDKTTIAKAAADYLTRPRNRDRTAPGIVPFPLYNLRHAYAIRLFQKGIPSDIGARLMGHSEAVHRNTYKRWYDAKEITKLRDHYTL